jgi:hypothetical protein
MANLKISDLTAGTTVGASDLFLYVDTADTTQSPTGTTKKLTKTQMLTFLQGPAGPTGATGAAGSAGATGATGAAGQGVPTGGTASQVLSKIDGTNYNTQWVTLLGGGNMNTSTYDPAAIAQQLVGLTAAQTLTNKNLTSGTNTFPTLNQNTTGTAANITGIAAVANGGTGVATLTGLVKGNGTAVMTAAASGTDYGPPTSGLGTGILKNTTGTGAHSIAIASDFPTLNQNTTGTAANITGIAAVANGGTGVATLTGLVKGNGTSAMTAAASGTDYGPATSALATGILKSTTGTGAHTIAVAADFPTLNQDTTGSAAKIGGITVTGTPTVGQVPTATSTSAATWQTPAGGGGSATNPPIFNIAQYTANNSLGQQAFYALWIASANQTINKIQFYMQVAQNASVIAVGLYSAALNQLGTGTVTLTSTAGLYSASFSSGVSVAAGTTYYLAILNQNNETVSRFAMVSTSNDVNLTSVVNSTSTLPTTMPAVGSRSSYSQLPYLFPLT